jgi:plasmid maintenance system killer protein
MRNFLNAIKGLSSSLRSAQRRVLPSLLVRSKPHRHNVRMDVLTSDHCHYMIAGYWSITVRANWRIIFHFEEGDATDVDLVDYH